MLNQTVPIRALILRGEKYAQDNFQMKKQSFYPGFRSESRLKFAIFIFGVSGLGPQSYV